MRLRDQAAGPTGRGLEPASASGATEAKEAEGQEVFQVLNIKSNGETNATAGVLLGAESAHLGLQCRGRVTGARRLNNSSSGLRKRWTATCADRFRAEWVRLAAAIPGPCCCLQLCRKQANNKQMLFATTPHSEYAGHNGSTRGGGASEARYQL